jgi:hypothetical protein
MGLLETLLLKYIHPQSGCIVLIPALQANYISKKLYKNARSRPIPPLPYLTNRVGRVAARDSISIDNLISRTGKHRLLPLHCCAAVVDICHKDVRPSTKLRSISCVIGDFHIHAVHVHLTVSGEIEPCPS